MQFADVTYRFAKTYCALYQVPHVAAFLAAHLRDKGILVHHFRQNRIQNWLRITVGTTAQCDALLVALAAPI